MDGVGRRWKAALVLAITGIAAFRIADTYRVFNQTFDEPAHIAAGMEWLEPGGG